MHIVDKIGQVLDGIKEMLPGAKKIADAVEDKESQKPVK